MSVNVGTADRVLRGLLGVALVWLALASGMPFAESGLARWGVAGVGVVMLIVAAVRVCPVYSLLGFKTCKAC